MDFIEYGEYRLPVDNLKRIERKSVHVYNLSKRNSNYKNVLRLVYDEETIVLNIDDHSEMVSLEDKLIGLYVERNVKQSEIKFVDKG
jgi:hypothetical protein